jgi:hypothetical protein
VVRHDRPGADEGDHDVDPADHRRESIICTVPDKRKAKAVKAAVRGR